MSVEQYIYRCSILYVFLILTSLKWPSRSIQIHAFSLYYFSLEPYNLAYDSIFNEARINLFEYGIVVQKSLCRAFDEN